MGRVVDLSGFVVRCCGGGVNLGKWIKLRLVLKIEVRSLDIIGAVGSHLVCGGPSCSCVLSENRSTVDVLVVACEQSDWERLYGGIL